MNFIDSEQTVDSLLKLGVARSRFETVAENSLKPLLVVMTGLNERYQHLDGTKPNLVHTILLEGLDQRQQLLLELLRADELQKLRYVVDSGQANSPRRVSAEFLNFWNDVFDRWLLPDSLSQLG